MGKASRRRAALRDIPQGRLVTGTTLGDLAQFPAAFADLEAAKAALVATARVEGHTWEAIGESLGVSKVAVSKRYGHAS